MHGTCFFIYVKEVITIEKLERIEIRVSRKVKQQIIRQAQNHSMTLSAYMLYTAMHPELNLELSNSSVTDRTEQLHIRLSMEAKHKLKEKAKLTGMSVGAVIEAALRQQKLYVIDLKEMARQTGKLGNNINQLTTLAHEGKINSVNLSECKRLLEQNLDEMIKIKNMLKEGK